ncbi:putative UDP-glucuronate:xylan alpha-glucuronosyltransferase 4 [Salvia divinorum]
MQEEVPNAITHPKPATNRGWFEFVARELGEDRINVALVNIDQRAMPGLVPIEGKTVEVDFRRVDEGVRWSDLYPSWINESFAECPEVPMPAFDDYKELDVVVARIPSNGCVEDGVRDVFRLQVNLAVANLLVRCGRAQNGVSTRPIYAVFIGSSEPMWEIFRCDDLVLQDSDSWIYKPQLGRIRQILLMPVGSCQLNNDVVSGEGLRAQTTDDETMKQPREAYSTILHSSEAYVCGAIALAQSIIQSNTTKDLVLLADDHVSPESINGLRSAGWKIKRIQRIRNPHSKKRAYNEWNYSKLRLWELAEYDKVMFIDSDFIVTRSLDEFFIHPGVSAKGDNKNRFNSGLMVLEPSMCTFRTLMERRWSVRSYNGGDQGFLNEMFPWWHRLPNKINHLTYFPSADDHKNRDHTVVPNDISGIHYLGMKPWWCYRDYDCNWDMPDKKIFASDSANNIWWDVYDKMPENLRRHCSLTPKMHTTNRNHRNKARDANLLDGHWKIKIRDPRLKNAL